MAVRVKLTTLLAFVCFRGATDKFFFAAPFMTHFKGKHMLAVHAALDTLYDAFVQTVPDPPDPKLPYHLDEVSEVEWVLRRDNLPDWTIVWSYVSRARLREMKRSDIFDPYGPDPVYQSTRIKPGAIVYRVPTMNMLEECVPMAYFRSRRFLYKVDFIIPGNAASPALAHLLSFSSVTGRKPRADIETGRRRDHDIDHVILPVHELALLEMNRGKTGALNFFNEYLRVKTFSWSRSHGMRHPVQTFTGILDARHALVETDIFWNDALPYFAKVGSTGKAGKRFGGLTEHSICVSVQYPQYFTNVNERVDVLDNTNSTYYTLWQTLRDGAKCICSSGSNAIWDISNPEFEFCTTSRSEDLGTSHQFIEHCASVYLCVNVSYAIAKKTEDFLDSLYRWSAGPVEQLWPSLFQWNILKHFIIVAIPTTLMALASFNESSYWYYAYLVMVGLFIVKAGADRCAGRKPLRDFIVSSVISINLFIVCSNLMSAMWPIVFPTRLALYGILPLGRTQRQGLFWAWISLFTAFPTGIIHDSLIRIAKYTAPNSKGMNFDNSLWRGAQLYACSFMFTLLATIAGTWSAFKACFWDYDLSMWSSFRVGESDFDKLKKSVANVSVCSPAYAAYLCKFTALSLKSSVYGLMLPTTMTKWYVTCIFLLQIVCIFVSTFVVNTNRVIILAVVIFTCGLNVMLTIEVVMLLQPLFKIPLGYPFRPEYMFGLLGVVIVISALINNALNIVTISSRVRLD
jgi:hypothetical protein